MRFSAYQYDQAIKHLQNAKEQLEPNGNNCSICGDSGHMAMECGFNPLVAVDICNHIAKDAERFHAILHSMLDSEDDLRSDDEKEMHEYFHYLAGYDIRFGVQRGPACIIMPPIDEAHEPKIDVDNYLKRMGVA